MASRKRAPRRTDPSVDVPVVGLREPCPCGSGRRYKACHGRAGRGDSIVARPFAGRADECEWVALREFVPAATATLALGGEYAGRSVTVATVLPLAWAAMVRNDGKAFVGLQVTARSGDVGRDVGWAIERAVGGEPGASYPADGLPGAGPRLQDLAGPAPISVEVHDGFDFWIEAVEDSGETARAALERANAGVVPTRRLTGVEAAYWCRIRERSHLRWVLPHDEAPLVDALARLQVAGSLGLGDGTRFVGAFRAHGLLVPVWDLPLDLEADEVEAPAKALEQRLGDALADATPLDAATRHARAGLLNRQLTLR